MIYEINHFIIYIGFFVVFFSYAFLLILFHIKEKGKIHETDNPRKSRDIFIVSDICLIIAIIDNIYLISN